MLIKSAVIKFAAFFITVFMLIPALSGAPNEKYDVKDPENCRLDFSILSDSHIEGNNFNRYKVFAGSLKDVKNNKSGNDAVIFLGDNTMNCQHIENMLFHGAASTILKDENIISVIGNHDLGNGEGDYNNLLNRWLTYSNAFFNLGIDRQYYYKVVDGYYFIVLGNECHEIYDMLITDEQYEWLEETLKKAAQSGKPAFVFSHYPTDDATDADGNSSDRLTNMLAEYNKENDIFCFVGHTHMPLYLFWSFHNYDGFPEIYLPRLTELKGSGDNEIYENSGVGIVAEVYDNEVVIRGRNFYAGEWRYDTADEAMCEMTYQLKNPIQ